MLPMEDRALLRTALTSLSVEDEMIEEIFRMLDTSSESLETAPVSMVDPSWFGASFNGRVRLGTNTSMAQTAIEEEMSLLVQTLRDYRQNLEIFRDDMADADATIATAMAQIQNASERVHASHFGDGQPDLPPATEGS